MAKEGAGAHPPCLQAWAQIGGLRRGIAKVSSGLSERPCWEMTGLLVQLDSLGGGVGGTGTLGLSGGVLASAVHKLCSWLVGTPGHSGFFSVRLHKQRLFCLHITAH